MSEITGKVVTSTVFALFGSAIGAALRYRSYTTRTTADCPAPHLRLSERELVRTAIAPVMEQLRAYSSRGHADLSEKARRFFSCYAEDVVCTNIRGDVLLEGAEFRKRYATVFRESTGLKAWVGRRFWMRPCCRDENRQEQYFIDCETFEGLVKPIGGEMDGSTGLSEPSSANIIVMYKTEKNPGDTAYTISHVWFSIDTEGIGSKAWDWSLMDPGGILGKFAAIAGRTSKHVFELVEQQFLQPLIKVGILNCPGSVVYTKCFIALLDAAGAKNGVCVEYESFQCHEMEFPTLEDVTNFHGIIITGSKQSAYDQDPWILQLLEFIRSIRSKIPRTKICGICFGHQAIAEALGGRVQKNIAGWEIGHTTWKLFNKPLLKSLASPCGPLILKEPSSISLLCTHGDHVTLIPPGFQNLGGNVHTPVQGMFSDDNNVLCFQSHPEFSPSTAEFILSRVQENTGDVYNLTKQWKHFDAIKQGLVRDVDAGAIGKVMLGLFMS